MSNESSTTVTKHSKYYLKDGTVEFQLDDGTLYKVHRYFFEEYSSKFAEEYLGDDASQGPVKLPGVTGRDFDTFLTMIYPVQLGMRDVKTADEWLSVLRLATKWSFTVLRHLALAEFSPIASPIDKIAAARELDVSRWLLPALVKVCEAPKWLTLEEAERLGMQTVVEIGRIREESRTIKSKPMSVIRAIVDAGLAPPLPVKDEVPQANEFKELDTPPKATLSVPPPPALPVASVIGAATTIDLPARTPTTPRDLRSFSTEPMTATPPPRASLFDPPPTPTHHTSSAASQPAPAQSAAATPATSGFATAAKGPFFPTFSSPRASVQATPPAPVQLNGLSAFGKPAPAFGQPPSAFGQPPTALGQPTPTFGQTAPPPSQPASTFGQPAQTFGQPAFGQSAFAAPVSTFGQTTPPTAFVKPPAASAFGQPPTRGFGNAPTAGFEQFARSNGPFGPSTTSSQNNTSSQNTSSNQARLTFGFSEFGSN
ncbi:hypothetical protein BD626DRAFT_566211 [Schizophyllum amplum]|uniref:BTB domain-containing protein n=1 Tax=Schizophyllum amplum TaxID=97359 RepID=A0A550CQX5_9AGAR|nr:hypothetical protein BD626DRAFT_566211 [Auriculariopsis ampla]